MIGWLIINKPEGWTSHQVVAYLRKKTGQKKVGHTGTLDPFATGVLVIAFGSTTRLAEFVAQQPKEYQGTITFGISTSTEDPTGKVLEIHPAESLTEDRIREVLEQFKGRILQVPPAFSAIKQQGERLYSLARRGVKVTPPAREVEIHQIELLHFIPGEYPQTEIRVTCSSGTYLRALARDIGKALGLPAHLSRLQRLRVGPFRIEEALDLSEVERLLQSHTLHQRLYPPQAGLTNFPLLQVGETQAWLLTHGQPVKIPLILEGIQEKILVLDPKGCLIALAIPEGCQIKPIKVFSSCQ